jgi:hypothetical protein
MESKPKHRLVYALLYQGMCGRWLIMLVYALLRALAETLIALEIINRRSTRTDETRI